MRLLAQLRAERWTQRGLAGDIRRSHPRFLVRVGCYVPVDDERLRDFLPDGLGGHVPVVQGPVAIASRVVRLADHDQHREAWVLRRQESDERGPDIDRKSTRLNSSHITISYAVFCL